MKKIDLHLHYDGSLVLDHAWNLAKEQLHLTDKEKFIKDMQVDDSCHNLIDYLARFDTPLLLLQNKENLYETMKAFILKLDELEYLYAEIRFAPQQHIKQGLSQKEVVETLCKARKDALSLCKHVHVNFILCMMILGEESLTHDKNEETINLAYEYRNEGVVAIDLAGAEGLCPMSDFASLFKKAREMNIPFTIHAGENAGADNVNTAIDFGAKRIGHGTNSIKDEKVIQRLKENNILLEVCVKSNVQTEVVDCYENHPIRKFFEYGIPVSINSDNMTISNTDIENERNILRNHLHFSEEEIDLCNKNAILHAFINEKEKEFLLKRYDENK